MKHVFKNAEVFKAFANQPEADQNEEIRNSKRSIFSVENILYSYGRHFPLAVKRNAVSNQHNSEPWVLLNGDKYSVTTSQHQSYTFSEFRDQPRISFRALRSANLDFNTVLLLDHWTDSSRYMNKPVIENLHYGPSGNELTELERIKYFKDLQYKWEYFEKAMPMGATLHTSTTMGEVTSKSYHRVGTVLLQSPNSGKKYLCGMDEGSYFIVELPYPLSHIKTIEQAFDALKPAEVKRVEAINGPQYILRQGEWFFILKGNKVPGLVKKDFQSFQSLPRRKDAFDTERGNRHMPTKLLIAAVMNNRRYFVMGRVYHRQPDRDRLSGEHRTLTLEKGIIYEAVENTAVQSWGARGVD